MNTQPLTDNSPMPFGKYQGKAMANVPAKYLLWLLGQGCDHQAVKKYIVENLDALQNEVAKFQR